MAAHCALVSLYIYSCTWNISVKYQVSLTLNILLSRTSTASKYFHVHFPAGTHNANDVSKEDVDDDTAKESLRDLPGKADYLNLNAELSHDADVPDGGQQPHGGLGGRAHHNFILCWTVITADVTVCVKVSWSVAIFGHPEIAKDQASHRSVCCASASN